MPKKLKKCVEKVKKQKGVKSAYAICIKSTGQKPHKRGKRRKR